MKPNKLLFSLLAAAALFSSSLSLQAKLVSAVDTPAWKAMQRKDYKEAFRIYYFEANSSLKCPYSKHMLSQLYRDGLGTKQDLKLAEKWLRQAADENVPKAQLELALFHERGGWSANEKTIPVANAKNYSKAIEWYEKAAGNYEPLALSQLALAYRAGIIGVNKDIPKALNYAVLGANPNNAAKTFDDVSYGIAASQVQLSQFYLNGNNVPQSLTIAYALMLMAAKADSYYVKDLKVYQDNMKPSDLHAAEQLSLQLAQPNAFVSALNLATRNAVQ